MFVERKLDDGDALVEGEVEDERKKGREKRRGEDYKLWSSSLATL